MTTPTGDAGVTRTEGLKALLERVRAATGRDFCLDQMLFAYSRGWSYPLHGAALYDFCRLLRSDFTGSIDAAIALTEEQLPGSHWAYDSLIGTARLIPPEHDPDYHDIATQSEVYDSAPLAILDALLQALIARSEEADHAE